MPGKVKMLKKQMGDKSVVSMFNQMMGTEDADPAIVAPKYQKMAKKLKGLAKMLEAACADVLSKLEDQEVYVREIMAFVESINKIQFEEEDQGLMCQHYMELKGDNRIRMLILTCKNLIPYKNFLDIDVDGGESFDDSFIARIPGILFAPLAFSDLNIIGIWSLRTVTPAIKRYMLTVMRFILRSSMAMYRLVTSADIDIKEFSKVIISSIAQVRKVVPRCGRAFDKIEKSVSLLEGNFDGYYKDFVQSQNPSVIIESFIVDVSKDNSTDIQTTMQFRRIIAYYRKSTQGRIKDPKMKKIFDLLGANFDAMDEENEEKEKKKGTNKAQKTNEVDTPPGPPKSKSARRRARRRVRRNKTRGQIPLPPKAPRSKRPDDSAPLPPKTPRSKRPDDSAPLPPKTPRSKRPDDSALSESKISELVLGDGSFGEEIDDIVGV